MIIETERLLLRPFMMSDDEDVFDYSKERVVGDNAGWPPHQSIEDSREALRDFLIPQENNFAIVLKESGRVIGSIGVINDSKREYPDAVMIGYSIGKKYWNQGITTQAAQAVVDFAFDNLGKKLISAYCFPSNTASKHVLEKLGFEYEGTLKRCEVSYDGKVLDHLCYSLIRRKE